MILSISSKTRSSVVKISSLEESGTLESMHSYSSETMTMWPNGIGWNRMSSLQMGITEATIKPRHDSPCSHKVLLINGLPSGTSFHV